MKHFKTSFFHSCMLAMIALVSLLGLVACDTAGPLDPPRLSVDHGHVYVHYVTFPSRDSRLVVFRAQDGQQLWQASEAFDSLTDATTVYLPGTTSMSARDADSGKERWHTSVAVIPIVIADGVLYAHDLLPVGDVDAGRRLFAFDKNTGTQLWATTLPAMITMKVYVDREHVYVHSRDSDNKNETIQALSIQDGKERWRSSRPGYFLQGSLLSTDGIVYVLRNDTEVDALQASTGKLLWSLSQPGDFLSLHVATPDLVVISSRETLYGLRPTDGKRLWQSANQDKVGFGQIIINQGVVYAVAQSQDVIALKEQDGKELWRWKASSAIDKMDFDSNTNMLNVTGPIDSIAFLRTDGTALRTYSADNGEVAEGVVYTMKPGGISTNGDHFTQIDMQAFRASDGYSLWKTHFDF